MRRPFLTDEKAMKSTRGDGSFGQISSPEEYHLWECGIGWLLFEEYQKLFCLTMQDVTYGNGSAEGCDSCFS